MNHPTAYPELNSVLHELVTGVHAVLGDNLLAVYLCGSFAVGDADEHSDVDFMVVIDHDIPEDILPQLQAMHSKLFDLNPPWSTHLDGSYFPKDLLKQADPHHTPLWYLDNGSRAVKRSAHDNEWVARWVAREHGIALYGPHPTTFIDPVPVPALKNEVKQTMTDWAEDILSGRYQSNNLWAQPFIVLSYCRMLHTLATGRIHSKRAGVDWAKSNLDQEWHGLIQAAWDHRPHPSDKITQPAPANALKHTYEFIDYALQNIDRKHEI